MRKILVMFLVVSCKGDDTFAPSIDASRFDTTGEVSEGTDVANGKDSGSEIGGSTEGFDAKSADSAADDSLDRPEYEAPVYEVSKSDKSYLKDAPPSGECDIYDVKSCSDGQRCDYSCVTHMTECSPEGRAAEREACTLGASKWVGSGVDTDCAAGLVCLTGVTIPTPTCVRFCKSDVDCIHTKYKRCGYYVGCKEKTPPEVNVMVCGE